MKLAAFKYLGWPTAVVAAIFSMITILSLTPCRAGFTPDNSGDESVVFPPNGQAQVQYRLSEIDFAPYSQFEFRNISAGSGGQTVKSVTEPSGPFIAYYHTFLTQAPSSPHAPLTHTITVGAWEWFHDGSDDRYALVANYGLNPQFGIQGNLGGTNRLGFNEEYAFLLFNPPLSGPKGHPKLSISLGIGPYYQSRDNVDGIDAETRLGFTALGEARYALGGHLSLQASVWYVDYGRKLPSIGFTTYDDSSLYRLNFGLGYRFK